jgi:hypothetical protein
MFIIMDDITFNVTFKNRRKNQLPKIGDLKKL